MNAKDNEVQEPSEPPLSFRTGVNLFLFSLLMTAIWAGFYRHLQPLFAGAMVFGGVISAWAIISLIYGWIKSLAGSEIKSMTLDFFRSTRITETLVFALFVGVVMQFFIASIYLQHGGDSNSYVVEVLNDKKTFMKPLVVAADKRWDGRPYLARFRSEELTFQIKNEPQYGPLNRQFRFWSSLRVRVPNDFPARKTTVIRLLPSFTLMNCYLPSATETDPSVRYDLEISAGDMTKIHQDLRKGSVYLGGSKTDIDWALRQQDREAYQQSLIRRLNDIGVPSEKHTDWLRHWTQEPTLLVMREFIAGELLNFRLQSVKEGDNGRSIKKVILNEKIRVKDEWIGTTTTKFLEVACSS